MEKCNFVVGDLVEAEYRSVWYKAKIISISEESQKFRVHYMGWKNSHDMDFIFGSGKMFKINNLEKLPIL